MLQVAEEEEEGMLRMGKRAIASLAGSYHGQSPAGKGSCSHGTVQLPLLFPIHPVDTWPRNARVSAGHG